MDDIELANPLGTARNVHKLCAVYWLLASVPSIYRSSLHVIQLGLLCKVPDLQSCGFESVLSPLLKDLHTLEQDSIFIEPVGQCVKSCVLQPIIWQPMVLQALYSVSEHTMSADFVVVLQTRYSPENFLKESLA